MEAGGATRGGSRGARYPDGGGPPPSGYRAPRLPPRVAPPASISSSRLDQAHDQVPRRFPAPSPPAPRSSRESPDSSKIRHRETPAAPANRSRSPWFSGASRGE